MTDPQVAIAAHPETCPACLVAMPHHQTKCQYRGLGADEIHQSMMTQDGDGDD